MPCTVQRSVLKLFWIAIVAILIRKIGEFKIVKIACRQGDIKDIKGKNE